jgi:hypothetical protein
MDPNTITIDDLLFSQNTPYQQIDFNSLTHDFNSLTLDELLNIDFNDLDDESKSRIITYFTGIVSDVTLVSLRTFRHIDIIPTIKQQFRNNLQIYTSNLNINGPGYCITWYLFRNNNHIYLINKNTITNRVGWSETTFNIIQDNT